MKLLAIETATELVGVAAGQIGTDAAPPGVERRAALWVQGRRRHAETLAPGVLEVLKLVGFPISALEAVAVDVGPGLFTGLRVGIATAKGLAQGLGIGLVPVGSLELLAEALAEGGLRGTVVAALDARRGEVFSARYHLGGHGGGGPAGPAGPAVVEELSPPLRFTPEAFAEEVAHLADRQAGGPLVVVGDGVRRYEALVAGIEGVVVAGPRFDAPDPAVLLEVAARRVAGGGVPLAPGEVQALYLREADAKINWSVRHPAAQVAG